jgi:adenine-specific DNA-methyltransferase
MPIKYIPYVPNTVEGQAVLDNITRTQRILRYRDNDKVISKIQRGMPYYEVETQEQVGKASDNLVIRGECLSACAYLKERGIKVDLVYIDPPFASGADYAKKVYIRRNPKLAEKIKQAEEEMEIDGLKAFEETMYGDIWQKEDYLNWMYENLIAIKSIMSLNGSIYLHLDWHISHYMKVLMDEIFGEENFKNEIVWQRTTNTGSSKGMANKLSTDTDCIFYYTIGTEPIFNKQYKDYSQDYLDRFKFKDKKGMYRWQYMATYSEAKVVELKSKDMFRWQSGSANPEYKQYLHELKGIPLNNLWADIFHVNPMAHENVGYSTQKPEELLDRIIKLSSDEKMIVADFFGGSGVTSKVANDLGRTFIHADIGINSIQTTRDRLKEAGADFQVMEIKDGVSLFRNPQQTMDKLAKLIPGLTQKVEGVGKFWFGAIQDSKLGTVPVYVPNLVDGSEKVLDTFAINRILNEEIQKLEINAQKAIVYYVDVDDRKELEKFIKDNNVTQTQIELRDLKTVLHDIVAEDEVETKTTSTAEGFDIEITRFVSDRLNQKISEFNEKGTLQSINKGKKFNPISISEEGLELIEYLSLDCENANGAWSSSSEIKIDKLGYTIVNGAKTKDFWDGTISADKKPLRLKVRNISGDESIVFIN